MGDGYEDVDYEFVCEPGKDEQDPLDFLSRHPLPISGTHKTEKIIKNVINAEHAIVLDIIRKETRNDRQLQKVYKRILKEDWESHRKDPIHQFYSIKDELYVYSHEIYKQKVKETICFIWNT